MKEQESKQQKGKVAKKEVSKQKNKLRRPIGNLDSAQNMLDAQFPKPTKNNFDFKKYPPFTPKKELGEKQGLQKVTGNTNDISFKGKEFEISNASAYIRDKEANWAGIKYKKGDVDLPKKTLKNNEEVPDESYIGKTKKIPKGTKVKITDVYIQVSKNKVSNDKLKYVYAEGYGWTSIGNIVGGLKNESVGISKAIAPSSLEENHYTVGVHKAVVLKQGNRYLLYKDKRKISVNKEILVDSAFKGFYGSNKSKKIAEIKVDDKLTYTSQGNYATKSHDKNNASKRKIIDSSAYERREVASFIPEINKTMPLGKLVIVGDKETKETGSYVEVFNVVVKNEGSTNEAYEKGELIGWTNTLNILHGFHTDLKGTNAKWDQVIPDERYDRAKGKDTEGTAKFTGNDDMIKIVDSAKDIEHVSKEMWPKLKEMLDAANAAGHGLMLNTGFRHWAYQQAMVDSPYSANPVGYSSHQIGIAVDLNNKTDINEGGINWWMERNAYKYGFVRTYKKLKEGHHWEYRPSEVIVPVEVEIEGKKYMKYTFATFSSESKHIWNRNHVLDKVE